MKPDCSQVSIWLSWEWLCQCLNTTRSKHFSGLHRREIGRYLEGEDLPPPFAIGLTCARFQ